MASHVELQTTQSVNQANGTPHRRLGRKLCFSLAISLFIPARDHRVLVTIRKDELVPEPEEAHERFFLSPGGHSTKTRANQP